MVPISDLAQNDTPFKKCSQKTKYGARNNNFQAIIRPFLNERYVGNFKFSWAKFTFVKTETA